MANRINCEDAKAASAAFVRVLSCRYRPSGWHPPAVGRPRSGFIELPKFKPESFAEKKMAVLWLKFLTEIDEKTRVAPQEPLDNPDVSQILEIVEESAYSEAEVAAAAKAELKKLRQDKLGSASKMKGKGFAVADIAELTGIITTLSTFSFVQRIGSEKAC